MTMYHATAKRWARGWELHIEGVGVTQSRTLADATRIVRDHLALDLGGQPESYDVTITAELDEDLAAANCPRSGACATRPPPSTPPPDDPQPAATGRALTRRWAVTDVSQLI